jgi:hypothetical protein
MAEKKKKDLRVTPIGIAVWPRVNGTPDTQFDDAGVWSTRLRFSGADAVQTKSDVDELLEKSLADAKADPKLKGKKIKRADAPYTEDEETGDLIVNFKMKASGVRKDGT